MVLNSKQVNAYQSQFKEAVAIVSSQIVEKPGFQAFRVKNEHLKEIEDCKLRGFHRHFDENG